MKGKAMQSDFKEYVAVVTVLSGKKVCSNCKYMLNAHTPERCPECKVKLLELKEEKTCGTK